MILQSRIEVLEYKPSPDMFLDVDRTHDVSLSEQILGEGLFKCPSMRASRSVFAQEGASNKECRLSRPLF